MTYTSYRLIGKNNYNFVVAKADPSLPIVIDPILQSTYLGGSNSDAAYTLAISSTGDIYVAGHTNSNNLPGTTGGAQASNNGGYDAFVSRLTADLAATASSGSGTGSGSGSDSGSGGSGTTSGGGGCSMVGSVSPVTGLWNIFTWLLVPIFVLARRIRTR